MIYKSTTAVKRILDMRKRLRICQGGSSAGKSIAILLVLIDYAQSHKNKLISIVSESLPHIKKGVFRDFVSIMENHNYYKDVQLNRSDLIYTFESGSRIEFFGVESPEKVRGPRRDVLWINECNRVSYDTYTQLSIRTADTVYLDYNPSARFWVHETILGNVDCDFGIFTYKDNEALPESIVKEIESRKSNKNFWTVYGEGQLGESEGTVYKDWRLIDSIPQEARLERYGLDFGYTNDPTAITAIYRYNSGFIFDQITYQKGLSNRQIADIFKNQPGALVIADSAEPKSIDEIMSYGINIIGAQKGAGSVLQGIQFVQDQRCSITNRSVDLIKSYRNYMWSVSREGKTLNVPDHEWSDGMDSIRYGMSGYQDTKKDTLEINKLYRQLETSNSWN
jgi:phage terminase large subunit